MNPHFWFVAAGTGGHIFPGIAVADKLKELTKGQASFLFWGDQKRLESKLVPSAGYKISFIKVEQWKGKALFGRLVALLGVAISLLKVLAISFVKKPDALVSVGGYVSVPVAVAARIRKIPVFLIEPNSVSGVANVLVSRWAKVAYTSPVFPASKTLKCPILTTGNPVRPGLPLTVIHEHAQKILVLGGSQGALKLSKACLNVAQKLNLQGQKLSWIVQVGEKNFPELETYSKQSLLNDFVKVVPFIKDMNEAYAGCDLVISRAGATTLAELVVVGAPSILVPFPFAADDHQRINAKSLQDAGASLMVEEEDLNFEDKLFQSVHYLTNQQLESYEKRKSLHRQALTFSRPHATKEIAENILAQIGI